MDVRHFRYFVAVAEALSFVRAARELHMSQPPLSKRIADLEEELGVRLFDRSGKKIDLTPAGELLLPHAREAVLAFDGALRVARSLTPSQSRRLRLAFPPETSWTLLTGIVSQLQQDRVEVHLFEATTAEQQTLLTRGEVDIGVLRHPFDQRGLRVSEPLGQSLGVVVDAAHPLARLEKLCLTDLNLYPLVQFQRRVAPGLYDEILEFCRAGGYVPRRILHSTRMTNAFLKTESAVRFASENLSDRHNDAGSLDFVWKPLETPIYWWTSVACRANEYSGLARVAFDALFVALQRHENWVPMPRPEATPARSTSA